MRSALGATKLADARSAGVFGRCDALTERVESRDARGRVLEATFLSTFVLISLNQADAKRQVIADVGRIDRAAEVRVDGFRVWRGSSQSLRGTKRLSLPVEACRCIRPTCTMLMSALGSP